MTAAISEEFSPYAPIRWRNTPWWKFAVSLSKTGMVHASGRFAADTPNYIMEHFVQPSLRAAGIAMAGDSERGSALAALAAKLFEQRHWAPLVCQYELNGRQIFDLGDSLSEMLLQTDLGDCTLADLQLPYECFYLRFGKQESIKSEWEDDYEYADGAFIARTPWSDEDEALRWRIKVGLSMVKKDGHGVMNAGYYVDLTPSEAEMPVMQGVESAMARRKLAMLEGTSQNTPGYEFAQFRIYEVEEGARLGRLALPLIVNALFYLNSLKSIPDPSPGRDTSSDLATRWAQAKPEKRAKLRSTLTADGYAVVKLLGSELDGVPSFNGQGGQRTHWRRGFWREQPYGPGMQLRRRTWIRPTVVNAGNGNSAEIPGHIYVAGTDSRQ